MRKNLVLLSIITILFILISNCKSNEEAGPIEKTVNFSCIVEHNKHNIGITKTLLSSKVTNFLAGYSLGYRFAVSNDAVRTTVDGELSMLTKQTKFDLKTVGNKQYLIEEGSYTYTINYPKNYKSTMKKKISGSGKDFFKTYNQMISSVLKKNIKSTAEGLIFPTGDFEVTLNSNGNISMSESFIIYIF